MSGRRTGRNGRAAASEPDPADVQAMRAALKRATRRLGMLELIVLSAAALAALAGGWLAALLAGRAFGFPFRTTWAAASLGLFLLPALAALLIEKHRRASEARAARERSGRTREKNGE